MDGWPTSSIALWNPSQERAARLTFTFFVLDGGRRITVRSYHLSVLKFYQFWYVLFSIRSGHSGFTGCLTCLHFCLFGVFFSSQPPELECFHLLVVQFVPLNYFGLGSDWTHPESHLGPRSAGSVRFRIQAGHWRLQGERFGAQALWGSHLRKQPGREAREIGWRNMEELWNWTCTVFEVYGCGYWNFASLQLHLCSFLVLLLSIVPS